MILSSILQAIGLFIATNIDDIIVLSLFFARGAGQRGTTTRIILGQYLGFAGILGAAVLVSLGAGAFLPPEVIPYFGLVPLALGLWAAWQAWRGDDDDDDEAKIEGKNVAVWTVAGVTFANGGDNIGVYVPVFPPADRRSPGTLGTRPVPDRADRSGHRHPGQRRSLRALTHPRWALHPEPLLQVECPPPFESDRTPPYKGESHRVLRGVRVKFEPLRQKCAKL